MPIPGPMELMVLLVIVLIIFGPGKLPGIGEAVGRGIREFRDATTNYRKAVDSGPSDGRPASRPNA